MVNDMQLLKNTIDSAIDENSTIRLMQSDTAELKTDVAGMKTDIISLKNHATAQGQRLDRLSGTVDQLTGTVDQLTGTVDRLSESHHLLGLRVESMQGDIKLILDAVLPAKQRAEQIDRVEASVEDHEDRLCAVELTVKKHLHDHREI